MELNKLLKEQSLTNTQTCCYGYGEIMPESMSKLMKSIKIGKNATFMDLGAGMGKVVLQAAKMGQFQHCYGIEANPLFHDFELEHDNISLLKGDFLRYDLSSITHVYTCSTCFSESLLIDLIRHLNRFAQLECVMSLKPMPGLHLPFKHSLSVECSWDTTRCYLYQK